MSTRRPPDRTMRELSFTVSAHAYKRGEPSPGRPIVFEATTFVRVRRCSCVKGVPPVDRRSSRDDLSALGDLSNAYLAQRPWWREVKTANDTLITAKRASDEAMEAAAEAEEKFDELKLDAEEKDRMCADIDKAENQTAGCDDHCSTGAVQASRLGWGSRSWSRSWSSWWRSVTQKLQKRQKRRPRPRKSSA